MALTLPSRLNTLPPILPSSPMAGNQPSIQMGVKVEGARELRREIRKVQSKDLKDELKAANKAVATLVAEEAKTSTVPVRSGQLKRAITALGSATKGQVKAGKKAVPYAGPIHFGWPARNIEPQPFLYEALSKKWNDVFLNYEKAMEKIADQLSTK